MPYCRLSVRATCLIVIATATVLGACESEEAEQSVTQRATEEIQKKYDELVDTNIDAPIDWATSDIENIGDWEYRVENMSFTSPDAFAEQLNAFGNDRWELIWLEKTPDGYLAFLKKPSISYLSKLPLSQIGRLVIGGSEGPE